MAVKISELVSKNSIQSFVGIGKTLSAHKEVFPSGSLFFNTTEDFLARFDTEVIQSNQPVLVDFGLLGVGLAVCFRRLSTNSPRNIPVK